MINDKMQYGSVLLSDNIELKRNMTEKANGYNRDEIRNAAIIGKCNNTN